jgi:hypothetical protein
VSIREGVAASMVVVMIVTVIKMEGVVSASISRRRGIAVDIKTYLAILLIQTVDPAIV